MKANSNEKPKLIRITTVALSLDKLLHGQLQFMSRYFTVIAVSADKEYLEKVAKRENAATFHVELTRKITPIQDVMATYKLYKWLKKEQPFIVHSHTPKAGIVGMLAAKLAGVSHRYHTVAGLPLLEATGNKRKVLDFVEKATYALATKVYPNSFGLKEIILQNMYCKPEKLTVIANGSTNGIDTTFFNPELFSFEEKKNLKTKLNISDEDFVFVFVGRLVKDKGINELVQAFDTLQNTHPTAKLLLVGDYEADLDPLFPKTLQIIQENEAILAVGFQHDVRSYLAISKVLVFPSYREGFPNVVMQAGAMGLPAIVSNINGCNEIIQEEVNGTIIPVKSTVAILDKMTLFMENEKYYSSLQKNARTMITSRYDQGIVWKAILDEYYKEK
jgi:glycosyltransferase involved in cell wall biosynthesis